jgi:uncharacterized membrane protein YkvA (DUF1232 family)
MNRDTVNPASSFSNQSMSIRPGCDGIGTLVGVVDNTNMPIKLPDVTAWARAAKRDGLALWFALRHPLTPRWIKGGLLLVVAYALSPIDLIPDFIPVIGYLDEVILLPIAVGLLARVLPEVVLADCRQQAEQWLLNGQTRPRMALGAVLIGALWLAALSIAWQALSGN